MFKKFFFLSLKLTFKFLALRSCFFSVHNYFPRITLGSSESWTPNAINCSDSEILKRIPTGRTKIQIFVPASDGALESIEPRLAVFPLKNPRNAKADTDKIIEGIEATKLFAIFSYNCRKSVS